MGLLCCRIPVTVIKPSPVGKGPARATGQSEAGAPAGDLDALRVPGMPSRIDENQQATSALDVVSVTGEAPEC